MHRFAQRTALSAVSVAVLLNTVADYSLRTTQRDAAGNIIRHGLSNWPTAVALFDPLALGLSLVESLPLAALAYAMATLLHRLAVEESQERMHRAETMRAEGQLCADLAQRDDQLAHLRADNVRLAAELSEHHARAAQQMDTAVQTAETRETQLAQLQTALDEHGAALAQHRANEADHAATVAQLHAELAQRDAQLEQLQALPVQTGDLNLRAIAAALREVRDEPRSWRQIEELIKTPHSTIRSWLTARSERATE